MKTLSLFLFCLLTTQAAFTRRSQRGHRYAVREVSQSGGDNSGSGGGGYHYENPSGGDPMAALMMAHHETMNSYSNNGGASNADSGGRGASDGGGGQYYDTSSSSGNTNTENGGYNYNAPAPSTASSSAPPAGFDDIQSFSAGVTATLQLEGENQPAGHNFGSNAGTSGSSFTNYNSGGNSYAGQNYGSNGATSGASLPSYNSGVNSYAGQNLGTNGAASGTSMPNSNSGAYDFNAVLNSVNGFGGGSGSSDQFTGVLGEVIDENAPSIFKYKPHFGGKDINNLPHILPPGGKSIQELQDEADAKLRAIVAKAKMNQMEVLERISKLKTNYGFGTLGYEGFKDTRFNKKDKIDLGSHKAIDLGTSIDYNALKGSHGKLKLPVQNVYHTKTLGIHIPEPYPVKHEVAVPAPFPVPHPIPVPQHKPTPFSPLSQDDIAQFSVDDGRGSHLGNFGSFGGSQMNHNSFDFSKYTNNNAPSSFPSFSSGSVTIQPSQSISESSSIGGLPYGAGTPMAAHTGGNSGSGPVQYTMVHHEEPAPATMFGLPPGSSSGALSTYEGPAQEQVQQYQQPEPVGQSIASEAGDVQIPQMNFVEESHEHRQNTGRPQVEYGPPR